MNERAEVMMGDWQYYERYLDGHDAMNDYREAIEQEIETTDGVA